MKRLQTMLWHHNTRVNSHQRWKQTADQCLLSSLVWIDHYNQCNRMTSFMEFMAHHRGRKFRRGSEASNGVVTTGPRGRRGWRGPTGKLGCHITPSHSGIRGRVLTVCNAIWVWFVSYPKKDTKRGKRSLEYLYCSLKKLPKYKEK